MPPPLNPQGSRAGLITAVVILAILFVTSAIFAFYSYSENSKTAGTLKSTNEKLNQYASADAQADAAVQSLVDLKQTDTKYQGQSAIQVAVMQNKAHLQEIAQLKGMVAALETEKKNLDGSGKQKDDQLTAANDALKAEKALQAKLRDDFKAEMEKLTAEYAAAIEETKTKREANDKSVASIQGGVEQQVKSIQGDVSKLQQQLGEKESELAEVKQKLVVALQRIQRPPKVGDPIVRQADGHVVRVPGNDNVFIDLGKGDQIVVGMTFEVYDRFGGVPGLPDEDDAASSSVEQRDLPKGKASIEVVRVNPEQSECRIIRKQLGQTIVEGDLIANLVYDKNTKYNFVVFGDFDLDHNNTATPEDAKVIKRLITQWGGKVQDDVAVSSDFIVLGAQPEVPPAEENETAQDVLRRQKAEKELEAYNEVISKARGLHVPILNQNRFLYYVGHYEQAQR